LKLSTGEKEIEKIKKDEYVSV